MAAAIREPQQGLTFEDVWAALMELRESQAETDRQIREAQAETNRQIQEAQRELRESQAKTDRQMQETDRKISKLGSRIGDLIEHLTASNILEKFKEQNYEFNHISRNHKLKDTNNQIMAEIDILLENGEYAMVVEVKSLLTLADVKEHIKRMGTLRKYADIHHDQRKYISSVSGALIEDAARNFALEKGIYVIEHTGDAVQIRAPQKARAW
ncbi:MAG: hypothetical protein LBQ88_20375 [Treponema sp.]|jgi:hypothetical protein|nr:hypothetical protein [Treponema sp.]